ncbi:MULTISPECIES: hypothetical protein [unclassified Tolypothrix]|uniref:hypothetical protein n=1 Tax=unclassified Tolypothrix TaxID=2649714 RepID=UPI0005EAAEF0|nr:MULTISPECIES: hypothetical protein [unclassified Tolypothrix]BAY95598.1 hypothetical protein NIES3275_76750 [Microchaete diplosiphon NIES-3275]EKE98305.1 hypothetical protein FDUTEX481_04400 [Tolypothrix sp. PCC 7601]MBE9087448.1 hypothetical protein [Tolypothrix sp. LEGE 11397]UYD30620.1 hypothetical protein HGR01_38040 [Tolypothrix sp. PCC 7712]UYD38456.1 hypothetical protein HG267_38815 [Tolypothrix sp. PCC 7601]
MTKKWLTPEQAIVKANLTVTPETLKSYIWEPQGKTTAEEQFQALGLLFDRERLRAGKPNFLQLLEPVSDENNYTDDEIYSHQLEGDEIETFATNRVNQLEPFIFEQCKVQIVITLLPKQQAGDRPVMIAASSHGDFPVVTMLNQEELGDLPPAIVQLLDELKADFPNRQIRRNLVQTQGAKINKAHIPQTPIRTQTTSSDTTKPASNTTQISLF